MPNPKRRFSASRRDFRRAAWKAAIPTLGVCQSCKKPVPPHQVCPHCGFYKGAAVVRSKEKKEKKEGT